MHRLKKGQNSIEYILLFGAVVVVLLVFFSRNNMFANKFNSIIQGTVNQVNGMVDQMNITVK